MGFVFEKKEPRFFFAVGFNLDFNGTGVDFLGFVEFIKLAYAL